MTDELQCPVCGRIRENWSNEETKRKAIKLNKDRQRQDSEDRSRAYRLWRWKWGNGLYVTDIDQLEYKIVGDKLIPIAVFELTRIDGNKPIPSTYLQAILDRYKQRNGQFKSICSIANRLDIDGYIIAYRHDLSDFWVFNLTRNIGWRYFNQINYRQWVASKRNYLKKEVSHEQRTND